MTIDLQQIRKDMTAYRRRFAEKWQEVYGEPFEHAVLQAKQMSKYKPSHYTQDYFEEFQDRIRYIKSIIEQ